MFIDTHCHLNMMVKKEFDRPLSEHEIFLAQKIISDAKECGIAHIVNVGTSLIESKNSINLAQTYPTVFATIGIHPNDLTHSWKEELLELKQLVQNKEKNKIVGIGECGLDFHYPNYNKGKQHEAFKRQIELSLEYDCALVIHSRDAYQETLHVLEEYKRDITRGIIHCFSYDQAFAQIVIDWGYAIGIDAPITYPKNELLRSVVAQTKLEALVLETDAPFLPPQNLRGKQNHPQNIRIIGEWIAELQETTIEDIALQTTKNAQRIFQYNV